MTTSKSSPDALLTHEDPIGGKRETFTASLSLLATSREFKGSFTRRQSEVSQRCTWSKALSRTGPADNKRPVVEQRDSVAKRGWLFNHNLRVNHVFDLRAGGLCDLAAVLCPFSFFCEAHMFHRAFTRMLEVATRVTFPVILPPAAPSPPPLSRGLVDAKTNPGT